MDEYEDIARDFLEQRLGRDVDNVRIERHNQYKIRLKLKGTFECSGRRDLQWFEMILIRNGFGWVADEVIIKAVGGRNEY